MLNLLEQYDWPGNVREMQNVIEYYVICSEEGNEMGVSELAKVLQYDNIFSHVPEKNETASVDISTSGITETTCKASNKEICDEKKDSDEELLISGIEQQGGTLFEKRDNYEKALIIKALRRATSARQAAKALGIFPSSLYRKAQKYGIDLSVYGICSVEEEKDP